MIMHDRTEISATSDVGPKRALLRFERLPAAYVHPERLATSLPRNLQVRHRDQLLGSKRLQRRLSALLIRRFDLAPCKAEDLLTPEGRFAQLEGNALEANLRRIGAIWHARTIAAIILASALKELIAWLGRDGYREALGQVALAGADVDRDVIGDTPYIDHLRRIIERDGRRCVAAWCRHQPAFLANRLMLKLPPDAEDGNELQSRFEEQGVMIADRVMMKAVAGDGNGN